MRNTTLLKITLLIATFLVCTMETSAQQWSASQQEVLDDLAECWDLWMEGVESGSPERWMTECSTPLLTYWSSSDGAPLNNDSDRRNWEKIRQTDLGWVDIRPVSITVLDDIAVLHFYGYWRARTIDGETVTEAKRTEVFRRIDGRWKMIAGHATPVTPADAAPYR